MKRIKTYFGVITVMAIIALSACNNVQTYDNVEEMVAATAKTTDFITVEELKARIDSMEVFNLIDVREPTEFYHGYIPGSTLIPRGVLEFRIGNEDFWMNEGLYLPEKDELFIIVSKKGSRSVLAAQSLRKLGYPYVLVLKGGWKKWELTYPDIYEKDLDALGGHEEEEEVGGC
jgi:rhodanese-related sulfurtransferase